MSFIIKKNLNNLNKKLVFIILVINLIFFIYVQKFIDSPNKYDYYLGNIIDIKYPIIFAYNIFNYIIYIYISIKLYYDSLRQSSSLLFTRVTFTKWNMRNILSILCISLFIKSIQFIFVPLYFVKSLHQYLITISLILLFIEFVFYKYTYKLFFLILILILLINSSYLLMLIIIIQFILIKNKKVGDLKYD